MQRYIGEIDGLIPNDAGTWVKYSDASSLLTASEARVKELESGYRVYKDGASWCAVGPGFTNLQESEAGFGDSPLEALGDLIVKEGV